jgi:molecular chaperone GrpE
LDDFQRAEKANADSDDSDALKEGFKLIQNKLFSTLERKGLKPMDSIGKEFNVDHHEAITDIPAPSEDMKGKVVDAIESGYFLNDRVLRFAKVVVGK